MKNKSTLFAIYFFIAINLIAQSKSDYLDAAKKAAAWITSLEVQKYDNALCWPSASGNNYYALGYDTGVAGIGYFFLKLYQATRNHDYLIKAEKAASYLDYQFQYGGWRLIDWLNGAAGYGSYYLMLYRETKNAKYLELANSAAQYVISKSSDQGNGKYYWVNPINPPVQYTGFAHGAAGIGYFLLELYEITNNKELLTYAAGTYNWLIQHYIRLNNDAIAWKRLTKDIDYYNHWCGGSVGIMSFLEKLHILTGKSEYLNTYKETANGLIKNSVLVTSNTVAWPYSRTNSGRFPEVFCHGSASATNALFSASKLLNDSTYYNWANQGLNWLELVKVSSISSSYYWAHISDWNQFDTGYYTGTAGIGSSFISAYSFTRNSEHIKIAEGAARFLLSVAESVGNDKLRWINYINENPSYGDKEYSTGWYSGAAGIGLFFVQLYEALNTLVSNKGINEIPQKFVLNQNYPNPFNPETTIEYTIPANVKGETTKVTLKVYDLLGREVATLVDEYKQAGNYKVTFNVETPYMASLPSGVYFYRLRADSYSETKKLILMK